MRSLFLSLTALVTLLAGTWWLLRGDRIGEPPAPAASVSPAESEAERASAAAPRAVGVAPVPAAEPAAALAGPSAAPATGTAREPRTGTSPTRALDETTTGTLIARPLPGVEARTRPEIAVRTPAPLPPAAPGASAGRPPALTMQTVPGPPPGTPRRAIDREARGFIADLTAPDPRPLPVERVDHFITQDQVLSLLPESAVESLTAADLASDPTLGDETPITLVRDLEQIETTTPERLIAEAAGDLDAPIRVMTGEAVRSTTVRELLERHSAEPEAPIHVLRRVRTFEVTTPAELASESAFAAGEPLKIIRRRYRLKAATVADLIRAKQAIEPDSVFYVRTVRSSDVQGLWGIVHDGIIGNFARGVAIRRGEEVDTYQVEIPRDADERLRDQSSSFLGRMIYDKTRASWVYNFTSDRMGQNPDSIVPGQELVIIQFLPGELIDIYRHFAESEG